MRILKFGTFGSDVKSWQYFLRGLNKNSNVVASSYFDNDTKDETIKFQKENNLIADGIVGQNTLNQAQKFGYNKHTIHDLYQRQLSPLSQQQRCDLFGKFSYKHTPTKDNPESISIIDDWVKNNIITIEVPQLSKITRVPKITCNKMIAHQIKNVFIDWESAGLIDKILTWDGMWNPRFIRGSRVILSNHAWGTAFDINASWNPLGSSPASINEKGSVLELVDIAFKNGLYWGGQFGGRPDGMHFEIFKIVKEEKDGE